ncbi:hypothetical protein, partial [Crocosphaera watsonii]|uniref:hypothetical protein n=1 Tax=Crocosphaera watsonii TaxID=263511 RepID=UPI000650A13D
ATPNQLTAIVSLSLWGDRKSSPFDDLDSTLENYTQLTNNSNYTPDFNTTTDSTLERLQPVF